MRRLLLTAVLFGWGGVAMAQFDQYPYDGATLASITCVDYMQAQWPRFNMITIRQVALIAIPLIKKIAPTAKFEDAWWVNADDILIGVVLRECARTYYATPDDPFPGKPKGYNPKVWQLVHQLEQMPVDQYMPSWHVPSKSPSPMPISPAWDHAMAGWLAQHKVYPEDARRRGEEGNVTVRFTVLRSGQVTAVTMVQSSGSPRLDAAAMGILRDAKVPPFVGPEQQMTVTMSMQYRLTQ